MKLQMLTYSRAEGWAGALPPWDSDHTLVVLFGAAEFGRDATPLAAVVAAYPRSCVIGCSTSGEIFGDEIRDGSVSGAVLRFESTTLKLARAPVATVGESFEAGASIGASLARDDLRGVLLLSDGLRVNGSELVRGLNSVLPPTVVVTGGLAGDGDRFESTWVLVDGQPRERWVCAVGLYGQSVRIGHGSKGGWDIFGPERVVTRSCGNVLFELDGRPALALYEEYLGELASGLPAAALLYPLALRARLDDPKSVVRTVLAVDDAAQSLTFAGDMPEGHLAQLMQANFDRLISGASEAAAITGCGDGQPSETLAIAISCVGRRLVLGERTEEELEAALEALPSGTRQIGFYSYGEISPFVTGPCDLHNQTMTLTTIRES